jgi:hypothetical protein
VFILEGLVADTAEKQKQSVATAVSNRDFIVFSSDYLIFVVPPSGGSCNSAQMQDTNSRMKAEVRTFDLELDGYA